MLKCKYDHTPSNFLKSIYRPFDLLLQHNTTMIQRNPCLNQLSKLLLVKKSFLYNYILDLAHF
jgi:hypothetical protein